MSLVSRVKYSAVAATLMVIPVDVCVAQVQINSQAIEITLTGASTLSSALHLWQGNALPNLKFEGRDSLPG